MVSLYSSGCIVLYLLFFLESILQNLTIYVSKVLCIDILHTILYTCFDNNNNNNDNNNSNNNSNNNDNDNNDNKIIIMIITMIKIDFD